MSADPRRFDGLERVVRDTRRELNSLKTTVLARLGLHVHTDTTEDLEFTDSATGVILVDRVTGSRYRLTVSSGTLSVELVV